MIGFQATNHKIVGSMRGGRRRWQIRVAAIVVACGIVLSFAIEATAGAAPVWSIRSFANTTAAPGGTLEYRLAIENVGDIETDGSPFTLIATLPSGMTANAAFSTLSFGSWDCSGLTAGSTTFTCSNAATLFPGSPLAGLTVIANIDPGAANNQTAEFEVAGGGAAESARAIDPTLISAAPPRFGIAAFDGQVSDATNASYTQAGGHPYSVRTQIDLHTLTDPNEGPIWPAGSAKQIIVDLPPGLVGDTTEIAQCTSAQLSPTRSLVASCPAASQVGIVSLSSSGGLPSSNIPVFNMVPPSNVPARFGLNITGSIITIDAALRTGGDYGLTVISNAPQTIAITGLEVTFWGFPADPRHDTERFCPGAFSPGCSTEAAIKPFLRNPTSCSAPGAGLETKLRVNSWEEPGLFDRASFTSHLAPFYPLPSSAFGPPQGTTGCELVPFDPTLIGTPASPARANEPTGFSFDLAVPQSENPDAIAQGDLKKAVVVLPEGVRVSPPSAAGLEGCAPGDIKLTSASPPTCPDASKIGTLTITTPLLPEPLQGAAYLATPNDNPSDTLLALYLVARGPGLMVKLAGRVDADPQTGQLSTTFDNNPQLPFSTLHLELDEGPRAPLVLPRRCGTYGTNAVLTSWSGKTVTTASTFTVERGPGNASCPVASAFSPAFRAGTINPVAGVHTPFVLNLARDDADEELRTLSVDMPQGILARINGVPRCTAAQAAAGSCGEDSRVGSVTTGAGAGPNPLYLGGKAFFAGPYKGAPFSLSIVVPAKAGPFDLGDVVVRAAIFVDRKTAALKVVSDPLPTILEGIPLQIRDVRVLIDRSRFILNPTSCRDKTIRARVGSTEGTVANVSSRFQVAGCSDLRLRPKLTLRVGGKGHTRAGGDTPLTTTLTQGPGQSGLKSVAVSLPLVLNGRLPVISDACTVEEFEANAAKNCAKARTGVAVARTPLLADPLRGSVYFVEKPSGRGLPNLVVALRGEVDVDLTGTIRIPSSNKLGTVFRGIPDVPISKFTLKLFAGKNGALGTTANLCSKRARRATANVRFVGQNGDRINHNQRLKIAGCKRAR